MSFLLPGCAATGLHWLIFKVTCSWLRNRGIGCVEYDSLAVYINLATNLHPRVQARDMCHSSGAVNTNRHALNNQSMLNTHLMPMLVLQHGRISDFSSLRSFKHTRHGTYLRLKQCR